MAKFWNNIMNGLKTRKGEFTKTSNNKDKIEKDKKEEVKNGQC